MTDKEELEAYRWVGRVIGWLAACLVFARLLDWILS